MKRLLLTQKSNLPSRLVGTARRLLKKPYLRRLQLPRLRAQATCASIIVVAGLAALAIIAIVVGYKFWPKRSARPFESMTITRLTNSGQVIDSILSPDGKYLVYALSDAGKQSLWIRQVSIANDTVIVPPAPVGIFGITFFARRERCLLHNKD